MSLPHGSKSFSRMKNPLVSIIILNWNGKENLTACLTTFKKVSYKPIEIIVVDNNSSDGSQELVRKKFPSVRLIANKKNYGYSGGNNIGIRASRGKYVLILNNDTKVAKNFLEPLVQKCELDKNVGCIQPKLLYATNRKLLNAVGSFLTSSGFLYHYGYRKSALRPQYNRPLQIFSAKGAAMLLRKSALTNVGLFDEDFFIYFEETDLCHRLWLAGYTVWYEPTSVMYHWEAIDTHKQMQEFTITYLSFRNRISSFLINLEWTNAVKILFVLGVIYVCLMVYYFVKLRLSFSWAIFLSIVWNVQHLPLTLKKRYHVQQYIRVRSDADLFGYIKRDPPVIYYYYLFTTLKNFRNEKPIQ